MTLFYLHGSSPMAVNGVARLADNAGGHLQQRLMTMMMLMMLLMVTIAHIKIHTKLKISGRSTQNH